MIKHKVKILAIDPGTKYIGVAFLEGVKLIYHEVKVISYAPSTVRKRIAGNGRASKEELSVIIVSKYPELKVYLSQDRAWKNQHHQNMFDAIALGLMALSDKNK